MDGISAHELYTRIGFAGGGFIMNNLKPTRIIFNDPATIVFWSDGSKTVVKCSKDDVFNRYQGFAMAYFKKVFGTGRKAEKFASENFNKRIKVFSKEKYYELHPEDRNSNLNWSEECEGLTAQEMNKKGYLCEEKWLVEKEINNG